MSEMNIEKQYVHQKIVNGIENNARIYERQEKNR